MFDGILRRKQSRNNARLGDPHDGGSRRTGATYARVSSVKQKDGISLDDQEAKMLRYAEAEGIEIPDGYRFRELYSGLKEEREEYEQIRRLIYERRISVLIVYSSDRHTRDPIHGQIFRRELRNADCELHYVTEGKVDIVSASGELINTVKDAFAKYWAQMILQTTKEKRDAYIDDGFPVIGMAPYGFNRIGKKRQARFEQISDLCEIVRYMYERIDEGWGVTELRENLRGKPNRPLVTSSSRTRTSQIGAVKSASMVSGIMTQSTISCVMRYTRACSTRTVGIWLTERKSVLRVSGGQRSKCQLWWIGTCGSVYSSG